MKKNTDKNEQKRQQSIVVSAKQIIFSLCVFQKQQLSMFMTSNRHRFIYAIFDDEFRTGRFSRLPGKVQILLR